MNQPKLAAGRAYLLFDGDCGICSWATTHARQMNARQPEAQRFGIEPYQAFAEAELGRFGLNYQICDRKLQVITPRGHVHAGAFAVNYFLWRHFPWTLLVALLYAIPVLLLAEILGYALVARNRRRLSQWFGLQACPLRR